MKPLDELIDEMEKAANACSVAGETIQQHWDLSDLANLYFRGAASPENVTRLIEGYRKAKEDLESARKGDSLSHEDDANVSGDSLLYNKVFGIPAIEESNHD